MRSRDWILSMFVAIGMLLTVGLGAIAPDSPSDRQDQGTGVTLNANDPKINNCSFWNAGANNIVNIEPSGDDVNLTNRQADVNTSISAGNYTYFLINVSLFAGNGILDLNSVNVTAWFDNGTETDRSTSWPRNYPNRNITMNYSLNTGNPTLLYPTTGEVTLDAAYVGFTNASTQEIAIAFRWGPNIRWGPGDGAWNTAPLWNDIDSWNFQCFVTLDAGGNPTDWAENWHKMEFGTYKHTKILVTGNPSTTQPPGSGWRSFGASPDQTVEYTSNAPFNITVNITDLKRTGGGLDLLSNNLAITGEDLFPYKPFWDLLGGPYSGEGYNFIVGANGTGYSSYEYINAGNTNLSNTGPTVIEWFAKVPVGTAEGLYTAKITWQLKTATTATP